MTTHILKDINQEGFQEFVKRYETADENSIVFIDSKGGSFVLGKTITKLLEIKKPKVYFIEGHSMGFDIFYNYTGPKEVMEGATGSLHAVAQQRHIFKYDGEIRVRSDYINTKEEVDDISVSQHYGFFTQDEQDRFNSGDSIFLTNDRLRLIFK